MTVQNLETYSPEGFYNLKDQLKEFVYAYSEEALTRGNYIRECIRNIEDLNKHQKMVKEKFIDAIGGIPCSDTSLNAKITGTVQGDGFRIEKVIFEARPHNYVTANLYIPDNITSPRAAVQFLCGHSSQAKHSNDYHTVCLYLVKAGFIVMAQDPVGQGERYSYHENSIGRNTIAEGTTEHSHAGCQCLPVGDASARYFVHDAMRGIDYLCSRPEVDPTKIGVTGTSGGGTQTSMMMICDSRIAAAAPGTFISSKMDIMRTGLAQDCEQTWPGMLKYGFDHEDILLCMVPKPVMVLAVKYDFFPIEGTRRSFDRARRCWKMYGKEENLQMVEDNSVHKYTVNLAKAVTEFFLNTLTDNKNLSAAKSVNMIDSKALLCTKSGQIRGDYPDARFIYEENLSRFKEVEIRRNQIPESDRREAAYDWLKGRVFNCRKPCDTNTRHIFEWQVMDMSVQTSIWWSQVGLLNHALTFRSNAYTGKDIPVTIAVWDGGSTNIQQHLKWIGKTCEAGRAVLVLNTSGVGAIIPNPLGGRGPQDLFGTIYKLADDLIWLDDSLAAIRTYDVLRAIDALKDWDGITTNDVQIYAHGRQGLYARLAAFIDERIKGISTENVMTNFSEWVGARHYDSYDIMSVIIPGMLKHFDLQDLDRWTNCKNNERMMSQ